MATTTWRCFLSIETVLKEVRTLPGNAADQTMKATCVQDLDEEELKSMTQKLMSLPCTVVATASGTRELLDLTYVLLLILLLFCQTR
jgi:hypothetical protein